MKCKWCEQEANCVCLCGFCIDCLEEYGHKWLSIKLKKIRKREGGKV